MRKVHFILLLSLVGISLSAHAECWKSFPVDIGAQEWRASSKNHFVRAEGDFDGDGKMDLAELVVSCDGSRVVVILILGAEPRNAKRQILTDIPADQVQVYGVRSASASAYRGVGKSGELGRDAPQEEITTTFDSVEVFKNEGVSSIFYWNPVSKKFCRLWISD